MCSADLFLGILAILFPPLPVWVKTGLCSADSIINILLCILGYIPGLLHSWYIISKFPESYEYEPVPVDSESGRRPKPNASSPTRLNYGGTAGSSSANGGEAGSSSSHPDDGRAPPTYAEAVKGDNKVQTHD
ncbi:hypothetical protein F4804DRAFT_311147 [Jackrogersella minutella]|nr:hypothetical protein F4804DRAFT_311147 [Jackrogersella minutella]